jgi:hypothetical protein
VFSYLETVPKWRKAYVPWLSKKKFVHLIIHLIITFDHTFDHNI